MFASNSRGRAAALATMLLASGFASAQGAVDVFVNGERVVFSGAGPQTVNNRVLVPLRGVLEKLGAYVDWDSAGQLVTATKDGTDIELRIGDRVARVNGSPVTLDVPAQLYRGRTHVPLRFMSEALGAEVRWDPVQYAVQINTGNVGTQPIEPGEPSTAAIVLRSFEVTPTGWQRPGSVVKFTLRGTAGGEAFVSIPGVMREMPMEEINDGEYIASWTVPDNRGSDDIISVSDAAPVARLEIGRNERMIQAGSRISVDNADPQIRSITPDQGARITTDRPNITAVFDDSTGSGIDPASVRILIDDRSVLDDATVTGSLVAYRPARALARGEHEVTIRVMDRAGNEATRTWTFFVDEAGSDVVERFTIDAPSTRPGDVVRLVLLAERGGEATFSIGDSIRDRAMREVSPGRYEAEYTIRRGDTFDRDDVVAKFTTSAGRVYNVQPTGTVAVNAGPLQAPTIASPKADASVGNPLVVSGRAAPNARVQVKVTYTTEVIGALRLNGTVAQVEVEADDQGRWSTEELDLSTYVRGSNTRYTVTAVVVGAEGKVSEAATVTVKRS
jgi:hypothetical protein